uniref:DDE Tnp4 domain-containing protein n=1 Tax=Scylla olivacea TaxID=85551 RepID=A0A0P4VXZ6_SCYOL
MLRCMMTGVHREKKWCDKLESADIGCMTRKSHAAPAHTQVLAALPFYTRGSFHGVVGNVSGLSQVGDLSVDSGHPYLVGDSRYLLEPLLMTPADPAEEQYKRSHAKTHTVDQTFGILKTLFKCLHRDGGAEALQYELEQCARIALICIFLYNHCIS